MNKKITDSLILKEFIRLFATNEKIKKIARLKGIIIPRTIKHIGFRVTPIILEKSFSEFSNDVICPCVDSMIKAILAEFIGKQDLLVFSELKTSANELNCELIEFDGIFARLVSAKTIDSETGEPFSIKRIDMGYTWYNLKNVDKYG